MSKALVVGGNSGIGLGITIQLLTRGYEKIYIVGKNEINFADLPRDTIESFDNKVEFCRLDLTAEDYSIFDKITDIDTLVFTAGFGRGALFEELTECEIKNLIKCNELSAIQIIKKYYHKIKSHDDFNCAVMVSISGHLVSPFFSVYGAAKSGLAMLIENLNSELSAEGFSNRILDCSPGFIKGTAFNGGKNDVESVSVLAKEIVTKMENKETLYIPQYDEVFKGVLERYHNDPEEYGLYSYNYKLTSGRLSNKPQVVVGFLSGTFDLFHIGHLNLLRRAKEQCDYLIVAVHDNGAWKGKETFIPYEERVEIIKSIKYVDEVVHDYREDADAWADLHYDKLFVGSDYKGTERFNRYEEYFKDKGVKIVYFPYTTGTSSTQLREALSAKSNK